MAIWVRMIMAEHAQARTPGATMGGEQLGRIDFEAGFRVGGDVAGGARLGDAGCLAEQQAAGFTWVFGIGMGEDLPAHMTCNLDDHHDIAIRWGLTSRLIL